MVQVACPEPWVAVRDERGERGETGLMKMYEVGDIGGHGCFNVPYHRAKEELWVDHPMLKGSDGLFAESSDDVVGWLLEVRKPWQRVMTTIIGRGGGLSDPNTWERWYRRGCDFFGYAWGTPPDFRPIALYEKKLEMLSKNAAFGMIVCVFI